MTLSELVPNFASNFSAGANAVHQAQQLQLARQAQAAHEAQMQQDAIIRAAQEQRNADLFARKREDDLKRDAFMRGMDQDYGMSLLGNLQPAAATPEPSVVPDAASLAASMMNTPPDYLTEATPRVAAAMAEPTAPVGPLKISPTARDMAARQNLGKLAFEDYMPLQHQLASEDVARQNADARGEIADARLAQARLLADSTGLMPQTWTAPNGQKFAHLKGTLIPLNDSSYVPPEGYAVTPTGKGLVEVKPQLPNYRGQEAFDKASAEYDKTERLLRNNVNYLASQKDDESKALLPQAQADLKAHQAKPRPSKTDYVEKAKTALKPGQKVTPVATKAELDAVPSGEAYRDPAGNVYIKK